MNKGKGAEATALPPAAETARQSRAERAGEPFHGLMLIPSTPAAIVPCRRWPRLQPTPSLSICDDSGQPALASGLEKKNKVEKAMALDIKQSKISSFGCPEGLFPWLLCFLVPSSRDAAVERSDQHQPSVRLHPVPSPARGGKRSPRGKIATPKFTTWIIFLNRLGTCLG